MELNCDDCTYISRMKLLNKLQWREFNGNIPSGYDWVLVTDKKGNKPRIAEYRNGKWFSDDMSDIEFESWYEVKYWKPIYDESVPCCGLNEEEWAKVITKIS